MKNKKRDDKQSERLRRERESEAEKRQTQCE